MSAAKFAAYRRAAQLLRDDARQQADELRVELERMADALSLAGGHERGLAQPTHLLPPRSTNGVDHG